MPIIAPDISCIYIPKIIKIKKLNDEIICIIPIVLNLCFPRRIPSIKGCTINNGSNIPINLK